MNDSIRGRVACAGLALLFLNCAEAQEEARPADDSSTVSAPVAPPAVSQRDPTVSDWTTGTTSANHTVSGVATLAAMRVAQQDSFERFVLEFTGNELPSYHVEYVDRPVRQCGSGDVMQVAGNAWLVIRLEPARAHDDQGQVKFEERHVRPALPILLEAWVICDFEAQVEWVLGVSAPLGYRISELAQPARLIVDLRSARSRE